MSSSFNFDTTSEQVVDLFADRVKGRIFLVTGPAPNGIGDYILRSLARAHPAALLLVGRSPTKYTQVADALREIDSSITVRVYGIDLSSNASVREGAKAILSDNDHIDVMINSAGVMGAPYGLSADGIEEHFAANHVGHFLLTNLLLPALKKGAEPPRVVNMTSGAQAWASGDYSDYNFEKRPYEWMHGYAQAKLANVQFSMALSKRGVVSASVHPGVTLGTNLAPSLTKEQTDELLERTKHMIVALKTRSQAASGALVAALDPKASEYNGAYFEDSHVVPFSESAQKEGSVEALWKLSEKLVGEEFTFGTR